MKLLEVTHVITLSSSYSTRRRIALHYTNELDNPENFFKVIQKDVDKINEFCGEDTSLSSHCFKTDSSSWQSVLEHDGYFEGVVVIDNVDEFIRLIKIDRVADGATIARYILSKVECTHLKLQKLVYFCYADYMIKKNEKLFEDKIYAYKYGPVIESVYNKYKKTNSQILKPDIKVEDIENLNSTKQIHLPIRSRIMFTENGTSKVISIDKT